MSVCVCVCVHLHALPSRCAAAMVEVVVQGAWRVRNEGEADAVCSVVVCSGGVVSGQGEVVVVVVVGGVGGELMHDIPTEWPTSTDTPLFFERTLDQRHTQYGEHGYEGGGVKPACPGFSRVVSGRDDGWNLFLFLFLWFNPLVIFHFQICSFRG